MALNILEGKDIKDLSTSLARLPANGGCVNFGLVRTKRLIGMMHWVQGKGHVTLTPYVIIGLIEAQMKLIFSKYKRGLTPGRIGQNVQVGVER